MDDFVSWLLEARTSSIRYLTLRDLAGRSESDPDLAAARRAVADSGPVPEILSQQTEAGHWPDERGYYTPKYISTHWTLLLLCELAADGGDPRMRRGAEFMLSDTQRAVEARLGRVPGDGTWQAEGAFGVSCLWGNILRYVAHCGLAADPRALLIRDYLTRDVLEGDSQCYINGQLSCGWGSVRTLWGLAALPSAQRTPDVEAAIQHGIDFLLERHALAEANYPTNTGISRRWFSLNFPLFYQADILFTLRVLRDLDALDHPGARPALDWLASKRAKNGRWRGKNPFRSRTWVHFAEREEVNRWVSLQAALVLGG